MKKYNCSKCKDTGVALSRTVFCQGVVCSCKAGEEMHKQLKNNDKEYIKKHIGKQ